MKKLTRLLSLLTILAMLLSLGAMASSGEASDGDYQGGSALSMGSGESSGEPAATVYAVDGELTAAELDDALATVEQEPVITVENGVTTIDGLKMAIHDFTANGLTVAGADDTVVLQNADITKYVTSAISGTAGGYIAGTTGGTLYIVDSVLSEDGRGGVGGNYTVYASAGNLIVENSRILQLGEEEGGFTSAIGEPGSNGGLLVYGVARANMSIGTSHTYYFDSYVETEGWAAMSTDAGRGVEFYSYNSTARAVNGGYGVYADNGCYDYMYGTSLLAAEMGAIIAGGGEVHLYSTDDAAPASASGEASSEASAEVDEGVLSMMLTTEPTAGVRSLVVANRTGIMIHSPDESGSGDNGKTTASTFSASGTDFVMTDDLNAYWESDPYYDGTTWEPAYQDYSAKYDVAVGEYIEFIRGAAILVKSTSANITLDDVTFLCENGSSEGFNTILMSAVNSDEHGRWVKVGQDSSIIQGTVADISNSVLSGDIKNYDYQRKMTVNLDNVQWTGAYKTWDKEAWDAAWSDDCIAAEKCLWILSEDSYNVATQGSVLTLSNGSVWTVTETSELVSLTLDDTSSIVGSVTIDGEPVTLTAGTYEGAIVITPAEQETAAAATDSDVPATDGTENQSNVLSATAAPATEADFDAYLAYVTDYMTNYDGVGDGTFDDSARDMALGELSGLKFGADVNAFPFEMFVTQFGAMDYATFSAN